MKITIDIDASKLNEAEKAYLKDALSSGDMVCFLQDQAKAMAHDMRGKLKDHPKHQFVLLQSARVWELFANAIDFDSVRVDRI